MTKIEDDSKERMSHMGFTCFLVSKIGEKAVCRSVFWQYGTVFRFCPLGYNRFSALWLLFGKSLLAICTKGTNLLCDYKEADCPTN